MILIIGAGDVGTEIATDLTDSHDVTVVDRDAERIESLATDANLSGVVGDGRSLSVLREAGIDDAEIVVASTDNDATNVMICKAATQSAEPHTIARVKDTGLYRTRETLDGDLGVDTMLCIDMLAAKAVARTTALPGAMIADTFADGVVEVAEFEVSEDAPIVSQTVAEADQYASTTFAALFRDGDVIIPDGETVIQADDRLVAIGSPHGISRFASAMAPQHSLAPSDTIVVAGGDTLGYQVAKEFEDRGFTPRIIERDSDTANQLTSQFSGLSVTEADATDAGRYSSDLVTGADLLVGTVDDDTNFLLSQLAGERGVERTAAVVKNSAAVELFESVDIDVVVHPQDIIAGEILNAIYGSESTDVSVFEHDNAEVIEAVVGEDSPMTGHVLRDAIEKLPGRCVIGAIIRNDQLQVPRGNKVIQSGDRVIAFVESDSAQEVAELF